MRKPAEGYYSARGEWPVHGALLRQVGDGAGKLRARVFFDRAIA